jgi:hypothetical protein
MYSYVVVGVGHAFRPLHLCFSARIRGRRVSSSQKPVTVIQLVKKQVSNYNYMFLRSSHVSVMLLVNSS